MKPAGGQIAYKNRILTRDFEITLSMVHFASIDLIF